MTLQAIDQVVAQTLSARGKDQPLAIILAGHNGSGKSTLWYRHLADKLQIPLINADRMMLSILPEPDPDTRRLKTWAQTLRDTNELWMKVAQEGVAAFVAQAIGKQAPFAMETVFSHWKKLPDGSFESKIDLIRNLQAAGYFVLLMFVGLASPSLSIGRVQTRRHEGGHDVAIGKLLSRFPNTQKAIRHALDVADASILFDNSRSLKQAFTPVHVRTKVAVIYDVRNDSLRVQASIRAWLDVVAPTGDTAPV